MTEKPTIPAPQYTLVEALGTCLALAQRALAEVRALARMPGPPGIPGPQGKQGEQGERGVKGEPGRNAADLTLLQDHINERVDLTLGAAAWTTADGGRTLRCSMADKVHEIKTAIVLDAGVWKEGTAYSRGDGVTLGGSFFIAQADTSAKPGTSDEWRLAVKRGADGRDHRPESKRAAEPVRMK